MWSRRIGRILLGVLAVLVVLAVLFVVVKPFRIGVLTLALVPELLEDAPRPLSAITGEPRRETLTYGQARTDRMDVYLPDGSLAELGTPERYPTMMLVLGVNPLPLDDERVVRTATALARLGFVVAAPESQEMRERRVRPEEVDHFIEAFEVVAALPQVDPDRIGMASFSAGAGISLLAAADERIADRVQYVNSFGGYGDAPTLLVELATRSMVVDGERRPWIPGELARRIFLSLVLDMIEDPADIERVRERIEPLVLAEPSPPIDAFDEEFAATLEGDAWAVYRLATARDPSVADLAIASLSQDARRLLARLSPTLVADGLRARIYLMHDVGDNAIPFSQLKVLAEAIPEDRLARVSEFEFFDHVAPGALSLAAFPELLRFFFHLWEVAGAAL